MTTLYIFIVQINVFEFFQNLITSVNVFTIVCNSLQYFILLSLFQMSDYSY